MGVLSTWPALTDALRAQVVDSAVLRFPKAVTHFSAGSYSSRPLQTTSLPNVFMAGDWVKGVPHGANGLSQVRLRLALPPAAPQVALYQETPWMHVVPP